MPLFDPGPDELSLPQRETEPEARAAELAEARASYRYTYAKPNLRGVAMLAELPKAERPDAGWLADIAGVAGKIIDNGHELAHEAGATPRAELLGLVGAIRKEGIARAFEELSDAVVRGRRTGQPARLYEYAELFQTWTLPDAATEATLDSNFARMRLAGPNPAWIRRVDPETGLADDFSVDATHFRAAIPDTGDSLEAALAEGRLYTCEYRELLGAKPGCSPVPAKVERTYAADPKAWDDAYAARQASYAELPNGARPKHLVAPLALFCVSRDTGALVPVAIQLHPQGQAPGGASSPVFTPRDGAAWLAAKLAVHSADSNVHEAISHLGTTHLVQEAFMLAMHNCLAARHPLHRLLAPHFEGTASINSAADASLVAAGGNVDSLLMPTIGDTIRIGATALRAWNFNEEIFPRQLERRGVADEVLRDYPYRDDGLLVWQAIEQWVRDYVHHHYPSDAEVGADPELQAFVAQVGAYQVEDASGRQVGGGIQGVGEGSQARVETRAYLVQMLTQIIWNGSAQHAAVNFPQAHEMAYSGLFSLALMGPPPSGGPFDDAALLQMLNSRELAHEQQVIGKLLGEVYYTRLGNYREGLISRPWFGRGAVHELEQAFQARLEDVERTIDTRNESRPSYRYLRPSEIPQSINI